MTAFQQSQKAIDRNIANQKGDWKMVVLAIAIIVPVFIGMARQIG